MRGGRPDQVEAAPEEATGPGTGPGGFPCASRVEAPAGAPDRAGRVLDAQHRADWAAHSVFGAAAGGLDLDRSATVVARSAMSYLDNPMREAA